MKDWLGKSAGDLGRAIEAREVDPLELTRAYLDAIAEHRFADRIYARLTPERALDEARAASARAGKGQRRSPLDGVPVSWKDLFDTAGTATESGSALLAGRIPDRDARVLTNATAMGLVCLGKTHMSELAFSGLGLNPVTATPPCVNNEDAVAGGSSSGAATSVAFWLAAAAIGSDTGGSVRVPAAWNDLVGLKTTEGRISCAGAVPLAPKFDTVGPLCRSVEDAGLLLAALEGNPRPVDLRGAAPDGLRLASLQNVALDDIEETPHAAQRNVEARLSDAGMRVDRIEVPGLPDAMDLSAILYASEAYGTWKDALEAEPDKVFHEILARFRSGAEYLAADYVAAWQTIHKVRAEWADAVAGYDAVICPATPNLPPDMARLTSDSDYYRTANLLTLRNTRIGNLMGLCALTIPTGLPSCGLMLMGRPMGEEALLRVGAAVEQVLA